MKNKNTKRVVSIVLAVALSLSMIFAAVAGFISLKNGGTGNGRTVGTSNYDYSANFDKNGYFKDVKAADYVKLPDYKSYKIPAELLSVEKSEVESEIRAIRASYSTTTADSTRGVEVKMGDTVNIDYVGSVDGVEFKNGSTQGNGTSLTLGSGAYLAARGDCQGFEEQVAGHKVGETFDITVQFPDGYNASEDADGNPVELSNAVANFNVTINSVSVTTTPEITDDFIKEKLSDKYDDYADMYSKIERALVKNQQEAYFLDKLIEESEISEYPDAAVNFSKDSRKLYIEQMAAYYGVSAEDILGLDGLSSFDEYFEETKEYIESEVKEVLVIQALCEKEGIKASDKSVQNYFGEGADYSSYETYYGKNYLRFVSLAYEMLDTVVPTIEAE